MARFIIQLIDQKTKRDYYLEWSTVVDAPVTNGMDLNEFQEYYKKEYGVAGYRELESRLKRVQDTGHSSSIECELQDIISNNRAGENESELTIDQILKQYCLNPEQ